MATKVKGTGPMCCVTIGYMTFLLPLAKGTQLVTLMQDSAACTESWDVGGPVYNVETDDGSREREISLKIVKPNQVRMPSANAKAPKGVLALEDSPTPALRLRHDGRD